MSKSNLISLFLRIFADNFAGYRKQYSVLSYLEFVLAFLENILVLKNKISKY